MKSLTSIVSALSLSLAALPLTQAGPLATRASTPNPTRPFTVAAFQSPSPLGQGITGYNLTAHDGNFYLSPDPNVKKAVLFVAGDGTAYLQSKKSQSVFIDTSDGHLGYARSSFPPGAVFVDFVHLGQGSAIYTERPGFLTQAPAIFQWIGAPGNNAWFACPKDNGEYLVFKQMTAYGPPDLSACIAYDMSALDYPGNVQADNTD